MLLLSFIIFNIILVFFIFLYNKLTLGICKCSRHLVGKVVIVTGGNTGVGYETAKNLAERGARVIIACRNDQRGNTAREKIISETGNQDVHYQKLDLASLKSVRVFAENILKTEKRLDILINNAGIYGSENVKTEDGLNLGMQVNHFGHFLLTCLLLPLIKTSAPSRIINVSSLSHTRVTLDLNNLNFENETKETYDVNKVYGTSKLCNILMTIELARQLKGTRVTANALNPGLVDTNIISDVPLLNRIRPLIKPFMFKTTWEGAQTSIYLAVSPEVENVSGYYYSDCRQKSTSAQAQDTRLANELWKISEKLVKLE
ncbi:retinol dehydrogenase 12-like [Galleria mellonella]|uniref:Retinol dehydrogenase 12-like n=1 Tax=Galleria mellonella TaxID=7137 RepID=A0ABM3MCY0_GALME|nr:retinol dehydrogenase 12-like [Galleria mellonella]